MATVYASDKTAKDGEPKLWYVEAVPTMEAAEKDAKYIQERVDEARWQIRASYSPRTGEPLWDQQTHMNREKPNVPGAGVDGESVTPRPNGPVTI